MSYFELVEVYGNLESTSTGIVLSTYSLIFVTLVRIF